MCELEDPWAGAGVVAIDPGREKCGLAALTLEGRLIHKQIASTSDIPSLVARIVTTAPNVVIVMGAGTASREVRAAIASALPDVTVELVPETHSTELALDLWRSSEKPRGWHRLLPRCLRFPPFPIDDYAAWVLALAYLDRLAWRTSSPGERR